MRAKVRLQVGLVSWCAPSQTEFFAACRTHHFGDEIPRSLLVRIVKSSCSNSFGFQIELKAAEAAGSQVQQAINLR
jgi:hypothetical protein